MNKKIFSRGFVAVAMFGLVACGAPSITHDQAVTQLKAISTHAVGDTANFKVTNKTLEQKVVNGKDSLQKAEVRLSVADSYFYTKVEQTVDGKTTTNESWIYLDGTEIITAYKTGDQTNSTKISGTADSWKILMATGILEFTSMSKTIATGILATVEEGTSTIADYTEKFTSSGDGNLMVEISGKEDDKSIKNHVEFNNYLITKMVQEGPDTHKLESVFDYNNVQITKYSV